MKPLITVTPSAQKYITGILDNQQHDALEISVNGKGCNGLSYEFRTTSSSCKNAGDEIIQLDDDHVIIVPAECVMYLLGSQVDYFTDAWQSKIVVENPMATSKCGCGTSFNID